MVIEGDLTWGGEHTIQYTDDVLENCTPETYIILLTNVTSINAMKIKKKKAFLEAIPSDFLHLQQLGQIAKKCRKRSVFALYSFCSRKKIKECCSFRWLWVK